MNLSMRLGRGSKISSGNVHIMVLKSANEAYDLLEEMVMNNQQWPTERSQTKKVAGMHKVDAIAKLTAQVDALTKLMTAQVKQAQVACELCGGPHTYDQCLVDLNSFPMDQVKSIGNYSQNNNYGHKQQGFYQQRNQPQQNQQQPQQQNPCGGLNIQIDLFLLFMMETRASLKTLETQMEQLATQVAKQVQGNSPSISKSYEGPSGKQPVEDGVQDQQAQTQAPKEKKTVEGLAPKEASPPISIDHHIKIPYPQRLRKNSLDKKFSKFLEIFRKLHINIPFVEALEQMPTYMKFMKEILAKKMKLEEFETVNSKINNIGGQFSSFGTRTLLDARGGLDPS
ncbi:uncharacterized protein LOC115710513 [Cannabis sativa]|uniref:uncharacterized protein LOC115710513 n=1 Tax=Cannabis sativa TaxID=3483 RepID=UPI0029CA99B1|nr:uncharacterized protein LOC115710513 [Cannabis sativa]